LSLGDAKLATSITVARCVPNVGQLHHSSGTPVKVSIIKVGSNMSITMFQNFKFAMKLREGLLERNATKTVKSKGSHMCNSKSQYARTFVEASSGRLRLTGRRKAIIIKLA
jgi:hypothetical protein